MIQTSFFYLLFRTWFRLTGRSEVKAEPDPASPEIPLGIKDF